jgi:hypothetical protein
MKTSLVLLLLPLLLTSCEFNCQVGSKTNPEDDKSKAVMQGGTAVYNGIKLQANNVKVEKAYLIFENGQRLEEGNFIDFTSPVKLILMIDEGWVAENGKVSLGAAEKITVERSGEVLLDEADLFTKYSDGISEADAKVISLTAILKFNNPIPPTTFTVSFKVWDKKGNGVIEGSYTLHSK